MMTEEIQQLLKNLRLRKMAEMVEGELTAARKDSPSYSDVLARLLRAEWLDQQERKLQSRIKRAHLPEQWTLESFPFKKQPGVSRRQIHELAELEFIPQAVNVVFMGPTGVGKTGLASGLLLKALQNGYRGLFIKAQDLFDEMYASIADGTLAAARISASFERPSRLRAYQNARELVTATVKCGDVWHNDSTPLMASRSRRERYLRKPLKSRQQCPTRP
jgi:DNA replication protein DnaC